ncbi:NAD(P)-binding protein [Lentinus tigrinus ALCF2SS1-7]|uniref:NAD(P)-binding protein n=1 Tax=Lentinus tigrinus ALCF2SS1-7 TaxID=1328758 RepID=UPI00116636DF|nr:NAD(P)-binding protein [Lentinus tigrinus ALCF2SS1-7]
MPAITSGKALVTGANGFVAVWVVQDLLEHGFAVRGTVRSESKATYLHDRFKAYGDKFEVVIVPDMAVEGAFDEAVEGIDAILHIASPVTADVDDPDDLILPAVNGTESVLQSALKHRATVKRVLYMSSCAAVYNPPPPGHASFTRVLDETVWNEYSPALVREKGRDAPGLEKYRASKTLAERAAWELYETEQAKGNLGWDLVTLLAPLVFGPIIHEAPTLERFGGTPRMWYNNVVKGALQGEALTKYGAEWVDVRDLARAHVLGLTSPEVGGQRFIIRGGPYLWQQFVDVARRYAEQIPAGDPSYKPENAVYMSRYTSEKSKKVLGLEYRTLEEMTKDIIEDLRSRGWL